jgi:hypothetical protein
MNRFLALSSLALFACQNVGDEASTLQLDDIQTINLGNEVLPELLTLDMPNSVVSGENTTIYVGGAQPNSKIRLAVGTGLGFNICPPGFKGCVGLDNLTGLRTAIADGQGRATFNFAPGTILEDEVRYVVAIQQSGSSSARSNFKRVRITDGQARLRVLATSTDASGVDIYLNDELFISGTDYLNNSGYLDIAPGTHSIDVREAGADASTPALYSIPSLEVAANDSVTALATGLIGSADPADAIRLIPIVDDWADPFPGQAQIRAIHASPDASDLDIDLLNDGIADIGTLQRFADSGAAGFVVPAELPFAVSLNDTIPFSLPALDQGAQVTLAVVGELGAARADASNAISVVAIVEDDPSMVVRQDPKIYIFHASTGAGAVDIQANGETIIDDLAFGDLSAPISVQPGEHTLEIYDETGNTFAADWSSSALIAGQTYLLTATGTLGTSTFDLTNMTDDQSLDSLDAQIRILHASTDIGTFSFGEIVGADYGPLSSLLDFGDISADLALTPGIYDLAIGDSSDATIESYNPVTLFEGDRILAIAYGEVDTLSFGIELIDTTTTPWTTSYINTAP